MYASRNGPRVPPPGGPAGLDVLKKAATPVDAIVATAAALTVVEPTANASARRLASLWKDGKLRGFNSSGPIPRPSSGLADAKGGPPPRRRAGPPTAGPTRHVPAPPPQAERTKTRESSPCRKSRPSRVPRPERPRRRGHHAHHWNSPTESTPGEGRRISKAGSIPARPPAWPPGREVLVLRSPRPDPGTHRGHGRPAFYEVRSQTESWPPPKKTGGYFSAGDLDPSAPRGGAHTVNYRGYDVWEIPPNGQGIVALNRPLLPQGVRVSSHDDPRTVHRQIEATRGVRRCHRTWRTPASPPFWEGAS